MVLVEKRTTMTARSNTSTMTMTTAMRWHG
jgi:hypothetical protein